MSYYFNDGGRAAAGYKGKTGDCAARALAIADGIEYSVAYKIIAEANAALGRAKSARDGIQKEAFNDILVSRGWHWVQAPKFNGRKARPSDLRGLVIARQAGHFVAVINGVCQDIFDSSEKMVYGYWSKT